MPDLISQARRAIEQRLQDLDSERKRLQEALAKLTGDGAGPSKRRATTSRRRRRASAKRAPRGQRQEQFLEVVKKKPGIKPAEAAKEMGVNPNQVYGLARRLHQGGQIRKRRGGGYALKKG